MQPEPFTRREYVAAFSEIAARIAASLTGVAPSVLPVQMYVAGGAARLRGNIVDARRLVAANNPDS